MSQSAAPEPGTVEQVFLLARAALEDERARGEGLEGKSSTLAGFTGAILALSLAQGRELVRLDLGAAEEPLMRVSLLVSVVMLALSALLYLRVLGPHDHEALQMGPLLNDMVAPRAVVQARMAHTLKVMLETERALNDRTARWMQYGGWALAMGLLGVAAQGLILGVDRL